MTQIGERMLTVITDISTFGIFGSTKGAGYHVTVQVSPELKSVSKSPLPFSLVASVI